MKRILFISILFGIILNNYGQVVINLSPDSTLYDLHILGATSGVDSTAFDRYVVTSTFRLGSTGVTIAEIDTSDVAALTDTIRFYITGSAQPTATTVLNASIDTSLKVGASGVVWDSITLSGGEIFWYSGGNGKNISEVIYTTPSPPEVLTISSPASDTLRYEASNFPIESNGTTPDSCMIRWDTTAIPTTVTAGNLVYRGDTNVAQTDFFIDMADSLKVYVSAFSKNDGSLGTGTWSVNKTDSVWIDSTGGGAAAMQVPTAYWTFDEASGDVLDQVGSVDGSIQARNRAVTGVIGTCDSLREASSDSIGFGDFGAYTDSMSISLWVRTSTGGYPGDAITDNNYVNLGGIDRNGFRMITFNPNKVKFECYSAVSSINVESTTDVADGAWHHVAVAIRHSDSVYLWVDGVQEDATNINGAMQWDDVTQNLKIGLATYGGGLNGSVDEYGYWGNYVLTQDDIDYLYNSGSGQRPPFSESIPIPVFVVLVLIYLGTFSKYKKMKLHILLPLLFVGSLSAQTYTVSNLYIQDSMKLGTSTNSVWLDTIKAGSIVITVDGVDYTMDGNPYIPEPPVLADYYVSSSLGDDSNNGTSYLTPWKTINKVVAEKANFVAGDTIAFNKGDTWYLPRDTTLIVDYDGSSGNNITFIGYGTGNRPKLYGSIPVLGFSAHQSLSNVYVCDSLIDYDLTRAEIPHIFGWAGTIGTGFIHMNDTVLVMDGDTVTALADLDANWEHRWQNDSLYFYYDGTIGDVDTIHVPQVDRGVSLDADFITINGFDVRYYSYGSIATTANYDDPQDGFNLFNSHLAYTGTVDNGGYGCETSHSNLIYRNNKSHHHGRRQLSVYSYNGTRIRNVIIEDNEMWSMPHTGIDIATNGLGDTMTNVTIRRNYIHTGYPGQDPGAISLISDNTRAEHMDSVYIYNNIVKHTTPGNLYLQWGVGNHVYLVNNTFVSFGSGSSQFAHNGGLQSNETFTIMNNIFQNYHNSADHPVLRGPTDNSMVIDTMNYNLSYTVYTPWSGARYVHDAPSPSTHWYFDEFADSVQGNGYEVNSPNPQVAHFVDSTSDWHLKASSPAIGAATPVSFVTTDYDGNARDPATPDIGAYEKQYFPFILLIGIFRRRKHKIFNHAQ